MAKPKHARPLHPPATETEKERAARLFTLATDDLVARGYCRHLWGNMAGPAQESFILVLRHADAEARS